MHYCYYYSKNLHRREARAIQFKTLSKSVFRAILFVLHAINKTKDKMAAFTLLLFSCILLFVIIQILADRLMHA